MDDLLVVGVVASAGGPQALKDFFAHVAAGAGVAYVVLLHVSEQHERHQVEFLQASCRLPVIPVAHPTTIESDRVYLAPHNQSLSIAGGQIAVVPMRRFDERRAPVDAFLRTLADARGRRAACLILSGEGADGTMGVKRIKDRGGVCFVQEPTEAEHPDLPRHAIATGLVDHVLPLAQMAGRIDSYARSLNAARVASPPRAGALTRSSDALETELRERRAAEERVRKLLGRLITIQEVERRRIARDLHDDIGQKMTVIHLKLESLRRLVMGAASHTPVQELQALLQDLDRSLDAITWNLRPAGLYDLGLAPAMRDYVAHWSANVGIAADFESIGLRPQRLRPEIEINLYRIAQEALNNVHKHSCARHVNVVLQRRDAELVLTVEDNGTGFDVDAADARNRGLGLTGMRERAALLNGRLAIEQVPAGGTTVIVTVPEGLREEDPGATTDATPPR